MKKKIMILGASELQLPAILKAKELGLEVISIDYNPDAIGFSYSDKYYVVSTLDKEEVLEIAIEEKIDGIMTLASDLPMRTVSYVAKKLSLFGPKQETVQLVTNKFLMRDCFKKNGLQSIEFKKTNNIDDVMSFLQDKKEIVLKPTSSSGSRGISHIRCDDDRSIIENSFQYTMENSANQEIIIEEFLKGKEVSVESMTINGKTEIIQITDKLTTGSPHFVEIGHSQPAQLSETMYSDICTLVKNTINAVNLDNGPAHTEIMISDEGLNIVEIGARLGGDFITSHLVKYSTGIDMVELLIKATIGEKISIPNKEDKGSAIRFLTFPTGKVKKMTNHNADSTDSNIVKYELNIQVGDTVPELLSSNSRYGYVIAQGNTVQKAITSCEQFIELISIEVMK